MGLVAFELVERLVEAAAPEVDRRRKQAGEEAIEVLWKLLSAAWRAEMELERWWMRPSLVGLEYRANEAAHLAVAGSADR